MVTAGCIRVLLRNPGIPRSFSVVHAASAGLVLLASEVKSLRAQRGDLSAALVDVRDNEAWLRQAVIPQWQAGVIGRHDTTRPRKLLLRRREITRLQRQLAQDAQLLVLPRQVFVSARGFIKCDLVVGKRDMTHDKRDSIEARRAVREQRAWRS